ncbi:E3 ubiquitin/ISG15 ligase TRIM25-like [Aquarana catesbeiana]|uniref:E3 ubiquitin/ISG15 ligase TRIM25-like n=1 Tax=Aquarana catesbeiana TaxID=8400 RepID=UPI003CC995DF
MASVEIIDDPSCAVCMNAYAKLMMLNCGHEFCRKCITKVLDTLETNEEYYSCPECGEIFESGSELQRFREFSDNEERLESTERGREQPVIFCSYCIDLDTPAVKSCLLCEDHHCEDHLRRHITSPEHVLVKPTHDLKSRKCPIHNRILEYYCNEDEACICGSCKDGGHQGHQVEKLEKVSPVREKVKTEKKLNNLYEQSGRMEENKADITDKVDRLFRDIRQRLEDLEERVRREVFRQAKSSSVSNIIQELDSKKDERLRKMGEIEELYNTPDQKDGALHGSTKKVTDVQNEACEQDEFLISMILHTGLSDIVKMKDDLFPVLQPSGITLDMNTAANDVQISDDLKTAKSTTDVNQKRPRHRKFQTCRVLSTNMISSGRHYWVVETSTSGNWAVGMCYPSIRKGQGWIGETEKSWGLKKLYGSYHVQHKRNSKHLSDMVPCNSFGVCLDYEAGRLSFYALCDPIRLLHTFTTTFTEPLHAVLQVGEVGSHSQIKVL